MSEVITFSRDNSRFALVARRRTHRNLEPGGTAASAGRDRKGDAGAAIDVVIAHRTPEALEAIEKFWTAETPHGRREQQPDLFGRRSMTDRPPPGQRRVLFRVGELHSSLLTGATLN